MPRVKAGNRRLLRRKKLWKLAKGNYLGRKNLFRTVAETVKRALYFSYRDRKQKKRLFRRQWTVRVNAALLPFGVSYSRFIDGLKKKNIELNRKMLAEIAIHSPEVFAQLVSLVQQKAA